MLDAAVAVFSRSGFHAASMEEIARRAGVSKPMVYLYLGGKENLFTACLRREGARLMEAVVTAAAPGRPRPVRPDERLHGGLRAFFRFVAAHRDGWAVLYRQARAQQPFAGEISAMRARMVEVLTVLLSGAGTGTGAGPVDANLLALILVGAAESVADHLADDPGADPDLAADRVMGIVRPGIRDVLDASHREPVGAAGVPDRIADRPDGPGSSDSSGSGEGPGSGDHSGMI